MSIRATGSCSKSTTAQPSSPRAVLVPILRRRPRRRAPVKGCVAMGTRLTCCPYRRWNSCGHGSGRSAYFRMMGSQARCRISSMPSIEAHGFPPSSGSATITRGASTLPFTQSNTLPGL